MSQPTIEPYALPAAAELPPGRVSWRPDPGRAALLVHDMQRYFLAPYRGAPIPAVTANITALADACRAAGIPVFYTAQPGRQDAADRGLLTEFWGDGIGAVIDDDPHAPDIIAELAPQPGDTVLTKWRYSAFQRSPFAERLAAAGRDQLLVTGIYAHIGCQATAVEAFMRDVAPFLVADAVADFSRRHHDQACEYVAQRCGVVTTAAATLAALAAVPVGDLRGEREQEVPRVAAAPPAEGSTTECPRRATRVATDDPAGPPPITTTSNRSVPPSLTAPPPRRAPTTRRPWASRPGR
jgi:bifunctional isochorismate lyase/aryl carrier protein